MMRIAVAIGSVCLLAACSHGPSEAPPSADITKIAQVKSDFGPGYKVKETAKTGIDPKVLVDAQAAAGSDLRSARLRVVRGRRGHAGGPAGQHGRGGRRG